jgi:hypothetical protein
MIHKGKTINSASDLSIAVLYLYYFKHTLEEEIRASDFIFNKTGLAL